jgi:hypothetical protein
MRLIKIYTLLLILSLALGSCKKLLNPEPDGHSVKERIYRDQGFAEGLLMTAYVRLPTNGLTYNDVATDNAVTNDKLNQYLRMATGQWSSLFNPVNQWDNCYSAIMYLNTFMGIIDTVPWKWTNAELMMLYRTRFHGEAYALRGLFYYYLLQTHGGYSSDGQLLGVPIYNNFIQTTADYNTPRATFAQTLDQIYSDFDKALTYLTDDYKDISTLSQLPAFLSSVTAVANYNAVFGIRSNQRISGRIVKALKARVALLAASPAFTADDPALWAKAANYAAAVLSMSDINGIAGLDPVGQKWYLKTYVDANTLSSTGVDQKEIIWRRARAVSNTREIANFPPSLYGNGNVNPTQNLVDAFPMANGYPISFPDTTISHYNPATPYATAGVKARDPRLALYIAYNGCTMKSTVIKTGLGGGANAKDSIQTSTRTGYYMRKLLTEEVNANPISLTTANHYELHMRYTELFLIYAEAANEAWGPDGTGPNTFSARQVIKAIRTRAGIPAADPYLASITTKADMRTLIRNERRIELCFEGYRFWDLRRWKADLTETAKGIQIAGTTYTVVNVEPRQYDNSYMIYGPLPYNEVLKFNALKQNKGW